MKKLLLSFAVLAMTLLTFRVDAQIRTPAPSPAAKMTQTIGLADVTVEYSRPSMKGRTIFAEDGLVPYGKVWRTGANAVTKITFGDDVKVGGEDLMKGTYAILTKPMADSWAVHFYPYESSNWGSYVEKDPAAVVTAKVKKHSSANESFLIVFSNLTDDSANLDFMWDNVTATVPLKFEVDSKVMAAIEKTLSGPSASDYYAAGSYLLSQDKDLDKALMYVQKATHGDNPRFWEVRREALILEKLGRKKEAIEAAKKSMMLAKEAGNDDYVRMNKKSIEKWSM